MENIVDEGFGRMEASAVGDSTLCVTDRNDEPYEGMLFESEDAARACYDEYAGRTGFATRILSSRGFATRILSSRKSERDGSVISRGLGCRGVPDNHRSDTISNEKGEKRREGCTAMIVIKRDKPGTWIVRKFVRDHNHPLGVLVSKRRPSFDEKDKKIQELTAQLRVKKRLSAAYRDQLLALMKDVENHNDHLTEKVQIVRNNLKELEAKSQQLLDNIQPRS